MKSGISHEERKGMDGLGSVECFLLISLVSKNSESGKEQKQTLNHSCYPSMSHVRQIMTSQHISMFIYPLFHLTPKNKKINQTRNM